VCHVACMLLAGKPKGHMPLVRSRCRWGNNIESDLIEIEG